MKHLTAIALILSLAACSSDNVIDEDRAEYEEWKIGNHVNKASSLRGTFCNGEGYKWYHEGKKFVAGTCMNGMVFHLPLRD